MRFERHRALWILGALFVYFVGNTIAYNAVWGLVGTMFLGMVILVDLTRKDRR